MMMRWRRFEGARGHRPGNVERGCREQSKHIRNFVLDCIPRVKVISESEDRIQAISNTLLTHPV